jgi:hypothetical protein
MSFAWHDPTQVNTCHQRQIRSGRADDGLQSRSEIIAWPGARGGVRRVDRRRPFQDFASRYRFDDGAVHDFTATTILGKNHSHTFGLPLSTRLDPGVKITVSKRLRIAVNFQAAGTAFLDFNVSGSPQALAALDCPTAAAR